MPRSGWLQQGQRATPTGLGHGGPARPARRSQVVRFSYASTDIGLQRADKSAGRRLSQTRRLRLSDRPVAISQVLGNGRAAVGVPAGPENFSKSGFSRGP